MFKHGSAVATIDDFLRSVGATVVKEAGAKGAEANTEPGQYGTETSHPSKNVDDNTQKAETGAQAAFLEKKIKEEVPGQSVDATPEAKPSTGAGDQEAHQLNIGTKQAPTGDDPKVETDSTKGGKDDPGSSHPARTDNSSLEGGKYAADMSLTDIANSLAKLGADILTGLGSQEGVPVAAPAPAPEAKVAAEAGNELANLLQGFTPRDKQAVDAMIQQEWADTIEQAHLDAENVSEYVRAAKQAAEEEAAKHDEKPPHEGPPSGKSDGPAEAPGSSDQDIASALVGNDMGGDAAAAGMSGPGGGAGGGADDHLLSMLHEISQKLGIPPEELLGQLASTLGGAAGGPGGGGAAPGGPPMDAGGAPPMGAPPGGPPMGAPPAPPMPPPGPDAGGAPMPPKMGSAPAATNGKAAADDPTFQSMANVVAEIARRSRG